jgi:hypothetical protein
MIEYQKRAFILLVVFSTDPLRLHCVKKHHLRLELVELAA